MIRVVFDPNVLATLSAIDETVEIRSADGRVIGYFSPVDPATAQLYAEAAIHFDPAVIASRTTGYKPVATGHRAGDPDWQFKPTLATEPAILVGSSNPGRNRGHEPIPTWMPACASFRRVIRGPRFQPTAALA